MPELKGRDYLIQKLNRKKSRVRLRYKYYEMKNQVIDLGISTPKEMRLWCSAVGWCAKSVDSLADRLQFRGFKDDVLDMQPIFNMNNPDTLYDSAILSALIGSCSFIYLAKSADGYPVMRVIDGSHATGMIDESTGLLDEGYCILLEDDNRRPLQEAYLTPERTDIYEKGRFSYSVSNPSGRVLLVPIINRPDMGSRPFGRSRISRASMGYVNQAVRALKRAELSAEFYAVPQKYVLGTDPDSEPLDKWRATISTLLELTAGENGEKPVVGQFAQASMEPHLAHLRLLAGFFSGESGLTMDDLGFPTDNPSSAEAIKAAHETLRLTAERAQRDFGNGFRNAGYVAACLRDNTAYDRSVAYMTTPQWMPLFSWDAAMLSAIGDGVVKLNQAIPDYVDRDKMTELVGF